jgi:hypothetical protein
MATEDDFLLLSKQLYPHGRAFWIPEDGSFEGLCRALNTEKIQFYNDGLSLYNDLLPDNSGFSSDDADVWERIYGLGSNSGLTLDQRKQALLQAMSFPGQQPARSHYLFIQSELRAAGFDVYVYENIYIQLSPELTNGPLISSGGVWYDGDNNGASYGSSIFPGNLAGGELRTAPILVFGKKYRVTIHFNQVNHPVEIKAGGIQILAVPAIVGTYTIDFTYLGGLPRVAVHDNFGFNSIVSSFSVVEILTATKTPVEVSGDTSLLEAVQYGQVEYGQADYGYVFTNKIANSINESDDLYFDIGSDLSATFFIGGSTIGSYANVPLSRHDEFRQLILKLKPVQNVGFLFINYI